MSITLNQARVRTNQILWQDRFLAASATSGSTTTLVDNINLLNDARGQYYKQGWLLLTAGTGTNRERQITADAPSTGTLTFSVATTSITTNAYEVTPNGAWKPSFVETAVNEAMLDISAWDETTFTGTAEQVQYALATIGGASLLTRHHFIDLAVRSGDANEYQYTIVDPSTYFITDDQTVLTIHFPSGGYRSTDTLRIRWWRHLAGLGSTVPLSAGTDTVPLTNDSQLIDWVGYETAKWLLDNDTERRQQMAHRLEQITKRCLMYRNLFGLDEELGSIFSGSASKKFGPHRSGLIVA